MASPYDRLIEWADKFDTSLAEIARALAEMLQPGSELRRFADAWPQIEAQFRSMSVVVRDASARAGLPPFRLLSIDDWREVEEVHQKAGIDEAAALVYRLSKEALKDGPTREQLLRDWRNNSVVATRIDILDQALKAHELGLYAVSIPPFLAHLEGIIADSKHPSVEKRNPKFEKLKEYVAQLAEGDELMGALITEFISDTVLQGFVRDAARPVFSRHAILHGFDTAYANEMNSVRAICTFDCVQDLVSEYSKSVLRT